jgi:DNA ligase (NAD+)
MFFVCIMFILVRTRNAFSRRLSVLGTVGVEIWRPATRLSGSSSNKIGDGEGGSVVDPPKRKKRTPSLVPLSKMGLADARLELVKLDEEIERHALLYYELDAPEISDAAFDKLVRRAEDLEGKFEALRGTVRHMQRVGYSAAQGSGSKFSPFNHTKPLMSLDNALNREELDKFFTKCSNKLGSPPEGIEYVVEPKIDGLSMALHYRDGNLVGAGTRGDGAVGEDVTANALMIANVPKTLPAPVPLLVEVRGEVYISTADFAQLNEKRQSANLSLRATPRNVAAGSLRQLDPAVVKERNLRYFAYELRGDGFSQVCSQQQTLEELSKMGFSVAEPWRLFNLPQDTAALQDHLDAAGGELRSKLGFDTDGAVIKLNKFTQREKMGQLARYPHWAVAFKFRAEEAETELLDIAVQVGRTGVLTPVAVLRRVLLAHEK